MCWTATAICKLGSPLKFCSCWTSAFGNYLHTTLEDVELERNHFFFFENTVLENVQLFWEFMLSYAFSLFVSWVPPNFSRLKVPDCMFNHKEYTFPWKCFFLTPQTKSMCFKNICFWLNVCRFTFLFFGELNRGGMLAKVVYPTSYIWKKVPNSLNFETGQFDPQPNRVKRLNWMLDSSKPSWFLTRSVCTHAFPQLLQSLF